jgi:hypothetical protein
VRVLAVFALAGCGNLKATPVVDADLLGSLRDGCALAMHMDEAAWTGAAGEVRDDCGGDNNGTATGGLTTVDGGVRGRAGHFGNSGCVEVADAPALHASTALTISAWVKPDSLDPNGAASGIVSKRVDTGNQSAYNLYIWTANTVWVDLDGESDRFGGHRVIANNEWTQITMVYDGTAPQAQRVSIYVDASLDITSGETSASLPALTPPLQIGCLPSTAAVQNFSGLLDEVIIWTRALAPSEVTAWHEMTKP